MFDNAVTPAHPNKIILREGNKTAVISRDMVAIPVIILITSDVVLFVLYTSAPLSTRAFIIC